MFLDPTAFSFTSLLEACFEPLRDELSHLHRDDFLPWPDRAAYAGDWRGFPLFLTSKPDAFVFDEAAHQARMPASMAALRTIPRLRSAALSRMEPGTHIYAHTDVDMPKLVRAHLGVRVPVGAALRVGTEIRGWIEGRVTIFDGQILHETANCGTEPRVVLLADVEMTPEEAHYVRSCRLVATT